jgi:hypothetical protein
MEVQLMGHGEEQDFASDRTTDTFAYSVNAESDFLVCFFECGNDPGAFVTYTYNSVSMTVEETVEYTNPNRIGCFYLVNPATGSNNFTFTWTNAVRPWYAIADFKGVHAGSPIYTKKRTGGSGTGGGHTIETLPLGYTVGLIAKFHTDWDTMTPISGQSWPQNAATSTGGRIVSERLELKDPAGAEVQDLFFTLSVSRTWHQLTLSLRNKVPLNQLIMVG